MMNTTNDTGVAAAAQSALRHLRAGQLDDAVSLYRKVLERDVEHREALFNMAQIMKQLGKVGDGDAYERRFLALLPGKGDTHVRMGRYLHVCGKYDEALKDFQAASDLGQDDAELYRYIGDTFLDQGNPSDALINFEKVLKFESRNASIHALMGEAYRSLNRFDEALASARKAVAINPNLAFSQRTIAWILLLHGDYSAGLPLNEKRFNFMDSMQLAEVGITPAIEKIRKRPSWDGSDLQGKTLLVWTEQGMGDNIMMMRYLPLLKQKGVGMVIVYCHQFLQKIMLTMNDLVVSMQFAISNESFDLQCSMMSLPHLFGTRLETIPADVPYLRVPAVNNEKWTAQLKKFPGLKVGIVWAGHSSMNKNHLRSLMLERFAPLTEVHGVQLFSLQKDSAAQQLQENNWRILDWMDACDDFLDTAALINNLDLVISVDTAVAHLAGALGKPVWLLNRFESEWRWMIGREDSPWYPTLRIFRQPKLHDWDSVIMAIASELANTVAGKSVNTLNQSQWDENEGSARRALRIKKQSGEEVIGNSWWRTIAKLMRR
jgi:tetratricopeptide (TPR) repeat protein